MKIDNQRTIYRIWLRKLINTIIFTAAIVIVMFLNIFDSPGSVITKYHIIIAISLVFIILSVIGALRNPYYFHFNDINDVLVFRYYPVGIFNSRKNSIEIPKQHFVKFEIRKFFLGMEEKLILYQVFRKKVANYPPISLSALSKREKEKLFLALTTYSRKN
jgi:hypothetical protein